MKNLFYVLTLMALVFTTSCSKDDKTDVAPSESTITYTTTSFDATFYSSGSSDAPTVNWFGNTGSFSLEEEIVGLTINSSTGVLK